ncbi:MAG: branched-chain amino acid ABC transporter permease, partial [Geodermatophilaceae bacterium]|nr:branched-chain amino acid ABC transporter permease [Geodermatophilaceae bacterium]
MDAYTEAVVIKLGIAILLALGYWITAATGKFSFGHAAFMAIGAYTASILTLNFGWSLPTSMVA